MTIETFKVKYKRPQKLSDPAHEYTRDERDRLLATPDRQLTYKEFNSLLGILPAGTYEETVYFLPLAFRYILVDSNKAIQLVVSLSSYISLAAEQLRKDNLLEPVRDCLKELFSAWTDTFIVIHLDEAACKDRGYGIDHDDYVENSQALIMLLSELVKYKIHQDLAEEFLVGLVAPDATPIQAAWFLELGKVDRTVYFPKDSKLIMQLVKDSTLRRHAAEIVRRHIIPQETSPTYWRDTFRKLGLTDMYR
ncbi:MAG: hypothetical protein U0521_01380 [Anaerolineae bacterium]